MRAGTPVRPNPQGDERAVSPVVGMIMVLAISLVSTVAVMTWGLPAIDEMKSNVEVQSVKGQMQEFLADVQELVAGTAGKTAKRWQPTLQRGELAVHEDTQPWIISVDKRHETKTWNFSWGCVTDTAEPSIDHGICVKNDDAASALTDASVKVFSLSGSAETQGYVFTDDEGTSAPFPSGGWAAGSAENLWFFQDATGTTPWKLTGRSLKVQILEADEVVAEAWFLQAGDVTFELNAGIQQKTVYVENGALFQGQGEDFVLLNSPPVPPPKTSGGANRFFVRFVELDGAVQFAGAHRNDVLLTLESTNVREDLDCPSAEAVDDKRCAANVKLYPLGTRSAEWLSFFTGDAYDFPREQNGSWDLDASAYVIHEPSTDRATFTLVHSIIEVSG